MVWNLRRQTRLHRERKAYSSRPSIPVSLPASFSLSASWGQSQKLYASLERRAPRLFRGNPEIACEDGWATILCDLFHQLESICHLQDEADEEPILLKAAFESFGALRVEVAFAPAESRSLIRKAEALSRGACIRCGAPARIRGHAGRLLALCDAHAPIPTLTHKAHRPALSR